VRSINALIEAGDEFAEPRAGPILKNRAEPLSRREAALLGRMVREGKAFRRKQETVESRSGPYHAEQKRHRDLIFTSITNACESHVEPQLLDGIATGRKGKSFPNLSLRQPYL